MRKCSLCNIIKPISEFYGISYCKTCHKIHSLENKRNKIRLIKLQLDQYKIGPCKDCNENLIPELMFFDNGKTIHGKINYNYILNNLLEYDLVCVNCYNKRKYNRTSSGRRKTLIGLEKVLLQDSKRNDKKSGRENNLTVEFIITNILNKPCYYCGNSTIRRSIDRINNSIGHLQSNVINSCIRCNYLRKNMPFELWIKFIPILKTIENLGLFEDWLGGGRYEKTK